MRARELRSQTAEQLLQTKSALESELLRHVSTVAANAAMAKRRREARKDLARVKTLLGQQN